MRTNSCPIRLALTLLIALVTSGCAVRQPAGDSVIVPDVTSGAWPGGTAADARCVVGRAGPSGDPGSIPAGDPGAPPGDRRAESITIVVDGRVDPVNAPVPTNRAERIAFAHLFGTLVVLDCAGRLAPALARSWASENDGRVWTFTLSDSARFADGAPVTPESVARGWLQRVAAAREARRSRAGAGSPARRPFEPPDVPGLVSVAVRGPRTLRVEMAASTALRAFASPAFAIARRETGESWPVGTNGYVAVNGPLRLVATRPISRRAPREMVITTIADARDAADSPRTDILLTGDARGIDYVRRLASFVTRSLDWDRRYLFQLPFDRAPAPTGQRDPVGAGPATDRDTAAVTVLSSLTGLSPSALGMQLARDVVRGEVRAAAGCEAAAPELESGAGGNPVEGPGFSASAGLPDTIYYPSDDAVARGIAERIVALARARRPRTPTIVATPASTEVFANALAYGTARAAAFVVSRPLQPETSCATEAPVLGVALVDTRPVLAVRNGLAGVLVDGWGTPWLGSAARRTNDGDRE